MRGGDRKTLTPANHLVENSVVEHFSLFKRTYEPAVRLEGCGIRISHNRFRFSSSSAIQGLPSSQGSPASHGLSKLVSGGEDGAAMTLNTQASLGNSETYSAAADGSDLFIVGDASRRQ